MYGTPPILCECCGQCRADVVYEEADSAGHAWTHHVCKPCYDGCTSDEDGQPVHIHDES